ncbi:L-rhamnose mutarotase [Chromohalobacter sarecensis]|uniref:L-rhamnose mutarotase n=1 Tax=Chromohalobacter sarecensis TaxID=245294 RepID=A0ABV9D3R6_9GAMM|nr:L-rhamnose mutarotase [Chromohalobacter sarecensis]MCK0715861.1 L-rhamnose mutarotase [Chromohalobacter sarecensis]
MRYCLALDLIEDEALIAEYEHRHRKVWPKVESHLRGCGVERLEILRLGSRLIMVMETDDDRFSFEAMAAAERDSPTVQRWEEEMWRYQRPTPWTEENNKWQLMTPIYRLEDA